MRKAIQKWSSESMRRLRLLVRNSRPTWVGMITLTYPDAYPAVGLAVKRQLNTFLQMLRRHNVRYVWVLEFQDRGAPHFHILIDAFIGKTLVAETWYAAVGSGIEKHLKTGTRVEALRSRDGGARYMASYMRKMEQKTVPQEFTQVGRFWGATRGVLAIVHQLHVKVKENDARRILRTLRRYYESKCRQWGFRWRWRKHKGFTAWGGAQVISRLLESLQQGGLCSEIH
jgi:hypothetical protein